VYPSKQSRLYKQFVIMYYISGDIPHLYRWLRTCSEGFNKKKKKKKNLFRGVYKY
jgi:hypothetical protein